MTKKSGVANLFLMVTGLLAGVAGIIIFAKVVRFEPISQTVKPIQTYPSPQSEITESKDFQSSLIKFRITIPATFQAKEKFTTVDFENTEGKIQVSRNSTNFDNLQDYILNLEKNNKVKITSRETLTLNGLSSLKGFIEDTKSYFILVDNKVYSISTPSKSLYDDLDQIAQSFRYIP